ncbi:hypothetical protein EX349_26095 [Pseudomonas protegens]|nr:hypothetical protein [Pseudomonas protegens]NUE78791.1 hypothetical protein [Pseudomonas protegens]
MPTENQSQRYTFEGAPGYYAYAADFDRVTAERDTLQERLNAADQKDDDQAFQLKDREGSRREHFERAEPWPRSTGCAMGASALAFASSCPTTAKVPAPLAATSADQSAPSPPWIAGPFSAVRACGCSAQTRPWPQCHSRQPAPSTKSRRSNASGTPSKV